MHSNGSKSRKRKWEIQIIMREVLIISALKIALGLVPRAISRASDFEVSCVAAPAKRPFQQIFSVLLSSRFSSQSFSIPCQASSTMFSCKRVEEEIRSGGRCWLGHLWLDCYPGIEG